MFGPFVQNLFKDNTYITFNYHKIFTYIEPLRIIKFNILYHANKKLDLYCYLVI